MEAHQHELSPQLFTAQPGDVVLRQGASADRLLLLTSGQVAIQVGLNGSPPHTLALIESEELLGEMGLFGNGVHSTDAVVINGPADFLAFEGNQLLQSMLFDADLAFELLRLISERCLQSNTIVGLLLDGIAAAHAGKTHELAMICTALSDHGYAMADSATYLQDLSERPNTDSRTNHNP
jgi:CRP-like cAMP-binding protein